MTLAHGLDELANAGMDFAVVEGFKGQQTSQESLLAMCVAPCIVTRMESPESEEIWRTS